MKSVGVRISDIIGLILLGLVFNNTPTRAQDYRYIFSSRVVDDSTFNAVRDCQIINTSQRTATLSNAYGDFRIMANVNDTVSFSAIGYEHLVVCLTDSLYSYGRIIKMKAKVYALDTVTIKPNVVKPLITKWEIYTKPLPNQGGINIPTGVSPVSFFYDRFSKEAKQKRYFKKVEEGTADFIIIGEKFNGEMVSQLTGLKDDEVIEFMSFCAFSQDFLRNYSPETIKRAVRKKYEEFQKSKGRESETQKAVK